ncbi:response regulator [Kineococcus gynurae]|uniref:Response regulator n=1 Tax=Kineococcus gynurae TaxID=452979 RepID=A0ABV5LSE9_9ACTN
MKVLVVDDSRVMRQIVIRTLRQAGFDWFDVVQAEDGRIAFDLVRTEAPGLILSDWNMPNMGGLELLQTLRGSGDTTPFGFVTSEGSDDMRETALANGALFLIQKPFTAEGFTEALDPVVGALR